MPDLSQHNRSMAAGLAALFLVAASGPAVGAATDAGPGEAVAVGSGPLQVMVVVETQSHPSDSEPGGERRFVPADRIRAGDEVHYTIRVTNPGRMPVQGTIVTKRLPFGLQYVGGSAVGPAATIQFSVDSGESFAAATDLKIVATGQPARRAAPADYTHVRWILKRPLAGGATALLRFRATLG